MDAMSQWDNGFPPLNLWNYNRHWAWIWEWDKEKLITEWRVNSEIDKAVGTRFPKNNELSIRSISTKEL